MSFVLDCSAALACCFEDEETPGITALYQRFATDEVYVPNLWRLEVFNALRSGIKRRRMTVERRDEILLQFEEFNILTDLHTDKHAWSTTRILSDKYGLTPYDASYLELAQRLNLPLATLDDDMRKAAKKAGVLLYPL